MATKSFINLSSVVISGNAIPTLQTYLSAFQALPNLTCWFDLVDPAYRTLSGDKATSVTAMIGAGYSLDQVDSAKNPTAAADGLVFNAANSTLLKLTGAFPITGVHTVVAILKHGPFGTAENIFGANDPADTRHNMFLTTTPTFRYQGGNTSSASSAAPGVSTEGTVMVLTMGQFNPATGEIHSKTNGVLDTAISSSLVAATMADEFYIGAARLSGATGMTGTMTDVGIFSEGIIGGDSDVFVTKYARSVRSVPV